jgi:hypothetical protein
MLRGRSEGESFSKQAWGDLGDSHSHCGAQITVGTGDYEAEQTTESARG